MRHRPRHVTNEDAHFPNAALNQRECLPVQKTYSNPYYSMLVRNSISHFVLTASKWTKKVGSVFCADAFVLLI